MRTTRTVVGAVAAVALAGGGLAATASVEHAGQVLEATEQIDHADNAHADYQDARYRLEAAVARFDDVAAVSPTLARLTGAVDPSTLDAFGRTLAVGRDVAASHGIAEPAAGPAGRIPRIPDENDWPAGRAALADATELATGWRTARERVVAPADYFVSIVEAAEALLVATRDSAVAGTEQLLAAHTSATPETRDAATATSAALAAEGDTVAALGAYADAVEALRASHQAEQERIAAEEAAAAAAKNAASTPRTSGRSRGGGGGGGSTHGGGGTSGGGSMAPLPSYDTGRHVEPRGPYTPGCLLGPEFYRADPGPGGTSIIGSVPYPYDYRMDGDWMVVYLCSW